MKSSGTRTISRAGEDVRIKCRFFGTLDAVALGLVSAADVGIGMLIDAREPS